MALNKEIWLNTIQENFFPQNSFASKSVDDSAFVNNKTVHVPNAGGPSGVKRNRTTKPAEVSGRTDNDLSYGIDELTTDPIYIPDADKVELSYDKRMSVIANDREQLQKAAADLLIEKWAKYGAGITTTGKNVAARADLATGDRRAITKADVLAAATLFNKNDVPQEGRYLLLSAAMYSDLLNDLTDKELSAFLASADAQRGTLGMLYGFNIMMRSQTIDILDRDAAPSGGHTFLTDTPTNAQKAVLNNVALAWQEKCVSRAMGDVKMFDDTDSPTYYGDIYSFLMRTGGSHRRYDKKGIAVIIEGEAVAETEEETVSEQNG